MIVSSNRVRAPGLRHARTPPPAHARSRAPAPPACEHPASPRPHPAANSRSLTRSRFTSPRTPSAAAPAPRRHLTLPHVLTPPLRANTRRRPAPTPPLSHARSRAHACRTPNTRRRQLTLAHFVAWRQRSSRTPEPGIQDVAEGVAEQVRAEHGEADRDPGEEHQVGCLL